LFRLLTVLIWTWSLLAYGSGEMPVTFNLSGKLYATPTGDTPLEEAGISLRIQILNSTQTCVLYDETQTVSTNTSEGRFSVNVGSIQSDYSKRTSSILDPNNSMATVFQNTAPIPAICSGSLAAAVPRAGRYIRITVTPSSGSPEVLSPTIYLGSTPSALVAETLSGLDKDQFVQIDSTTALTQSNVANIFTTANYNTLLSLLAGSSPSGGVGSATDYVITANSDNTGTPGSIQFVIGSDKKAEITQAGNFYAKQSIGIGDTTPSFDLSFGGDADRTIGVERESLLNSTGNKLVVSSGGSKAGSNNTAGGNLFLASGASTGNAGSSILFQTPTPSASGVGDNLPITKMILDPLGYLGLGNSSPDKPLHITSGAAPTILLENSGGGTDQKRRYISTSVTGDFTIGRFSDNMAGTYEHMRILANGNVGIGVTNPGAALEVEAGSTTLAPLKLNAGPSLVSAVDGALEFDGTKLTFTIGGVRMNLAGGGATTLTSTNFGSGSASAPGFAVNGDSDTGISSPASDTLSIDAGGVEAMRFNTAASAVNYLSVTPAATGSGPIIGAEGSDTNVNLTFAPKGTGSSNFLGKVGIATTTPTASLSIGDSLLATATSPTNTYNKFVINDAPTILTGGYASMAILHQSNPAGDPAGLYAGQVIDMSTMAGSAVNYGNYYANQITQNHNGTGLVNKLYGINIDSKNTSSGSVGNQKSFSSNASNTGSGAITSQSALTAATTNSGSGTITSQFGASVTATTSGTAVATNQYGLAAQTANASNSTTGVTNAYGLYTSVGNSGSGILANGYGLYIASVRGTARWSVYAPDSTAPSFLAGNLGIGTAATPVSKLHVNSAPTSDTKVGLVSLGSGPFDGSTAGFYAGHASGTVLAANAATGFAGDLLNFQIGGVSKFKIDSTGAVTSSGNVSETGSYTQAYAGTGSASTITANASTGGNVTSVTSSSTAVGANQAGLSILLSGSNSAASLSRYGVYSSVTATGTTNTNVGGYFSATGGINNYGLIVANGNTGLGDATPARKLSVQTSSANDGIRLGGTSNFSLLSTNLGTSSYNALTLSGDQGLFFGNSGALDTYTNGFVIAPWSAASKGLRMDKDGNVALGAPSTASLLQIGGTTGLSIPSWTTAGALLYMPGQTITDNSGTGTIAHRTVASIGTSTLASTNAETLTNASSLYIAGAPSSGTNTSITNPYALYVANGTNYFAGNVGVGTATPQAKLESAYTTTRYVRLNDNTETGNFGTGTRSTFRSDDNSQASILSFENLDSTASIVHGANIINRFSYTSGANAPIIASRIKFTKENEWTATASTQNSSMAFDTATNGVASTKMLIKGNGFVGINNNSPLYQLDVSGNIRMGSAFTFFVGTTAVCTITGCTAAPSDRRYKENIKPLEHAYSNILKLEGVSYDWKDKKLFGNDHQIGFIAQALEKVFPEVVKTDSKSGMKSVMYDKLVAPLVEAFKVLVSKLNATDARVEALERENAQMKLRLERLEKQLTAK
jgi:trimeric autotransporter adhesin